MKYNQKSFNLRKKYTTILFLLFIVLLFTKIDFRLKTDITCCSDDFDYFIHAETIVEDFDFDYSNQLEGFENKRFNKSKLAPKGFLGAGLLASPFLFLGNLLDVLFGEISYNHVNFKILLYSFAPYFYFVSSLYFIFKSMINLDFNISPEATLLFISGSGVIYYFTERYSMTHVYEVFACSLIIFLSSSYYSTKKNMYALLIPFAIFIGFEIKWIHFYFFLIPFLVKHLKNSHIKLSQNKYFISSAVFFFAFHFILSKLIYGVYTISWKYVHYNFEGDGDFVKDYFISGLNSPMFYLTNLKNVFIHFYTQEFGLIYFQPITFLLIFGSLVFLIYSLIKKENILIALLFFLFSWQEFGIVLIWTSPASSYGFRYLMNLAPLGLLFFGYIKNNYKFKFIQNYLIIFSCFSILSVLFFETTEYTQLSLDATANSFGDYSKYTQRYYLSGFFKSVLIIDSYLKIFTTSFLGMFIIKIFASYYTPEGLNSLLGTYGLPISNEKFQILLIQLNETRWIFFVISLLLCFLFVILIVKFLKIQHTVQNYNI
jgi:hypothetical protein